MNHEIDTYFLKSTDEAVEYRLGFTDFHERIKSYGKILYNHSILSYDNESIYFIDKLHLTFCLVEKINRSIVDAFYKREQYCIDDHLIIKPNYGNGNNYHYSFNILYDGSHFGYLHIANTKKTKICKIEIDNRTLYERNIIYILARIYHIALTFGLRFNNINTYEIARDTPEPLYSKLSEIYYQSTKCNTTVNMLIGNPPQFKPVTKTKIHDYPDDNGMGGTFIIGANKSEAVVRIYSKTPEIVDNGHKKDYIHEIHLKHFGLTDSITRAEVAIFANAFRLSGILNSHDCSIIEILIPKNFPSLYFKALGEKLTFHRLASKTWDEANNDKYERIRLIQEPENSSIRQKKVSLVPTTTRFSHSNNVNRFKFKLVEYLDGEIPYMELKRYFVAKRGKNDLNVDEVSKAYTIIKRNYNNALNHVQDERINKLILSLRKGNVISRLKKTLRHVFAKMTMKQ
jgi:hypothetical protein